MTYRNIIEDWYKEHQGNISLEDLQGFISHIGKMIVEEVRVKNAATNERGFSPEPLNSGTHIHFDFNLYLILFII